MDASTLWRKIRPLLTQGMLATVASQCGGGDGAIFVPGGSDGTVSISVTDAPVDDATKAFVQFSSIVLTPDSGDDVTIDLGNRSLDLLTLSDGVTSTLVSNQTIDTGTYTSLQLKVSADGASQTSYVVLPDGSQYPLVIPNNGDDGLTLKKSFTVSDDARLDLVIDVDLRKSITQTGSNQTYEFRPVIRVVDSANAGSVSGTIDSDLVPTSCTAPYVYVYSGSGVTPADININSSAGQPVVTAQVKLNVSSNVYTYRASYLDAGDYTLAYTCDGTDDDPRTNDTLVFSRTGNASVTANQTTTLDFSS